MRIWRPRPLDDGAKTQLLEFWRICAPRVLKGQYCKAGIFNIISQKSFPEKKAGSRAFDKARLPRFAWRLLSPASKDGISMSTPWKLTPPLRCLPPILHSEEVLSSRGRRGLEYLTTQDYSRLQSSPESPQGFPLACLFPREPTFFYHTSITESICCAGP